MLVYLVDHNEVLDKSKTLKAYEADITEFYGRINTLKVGTLIDINRITYEICGREYSKAHDEWYYIYRYYVPFKIETLRVEGKDIIGNDNLK